MTHALVFEWFGSDPSRKPLLLTGHQGQFPLRPLRLFSVQVNEQMLSLSCPTLEVCGHTILTVESTRNRPIVFGVGDPRTTSLVSSACCRLWSYCSSLGSSLHRGLSSCLWALTKRLVERLFVFSSLLAVSGPTGWRLT